VDRFSHGSVRHAETQVVPHFDSGRHFEERGGEIHRHDIIVHHDFDAGFHRHHHFHDFVFVFIRRNIEGFSEVLRISVLRQEAMNLYEKG
jgi:hypothetical protein